MTVREAAKLLCLSKHGVQWRIFKGYLKAEKIRCGPKGHWQWDISSEEIGRIQRSKA